MSNNVVTIEINETIIRVCAPRVRRGRKGETVEYDARFDAPTPKGTIVGGHIKEPKLVGEFIAAELAKRGLTAKSVIFSIYSDRIAVKEVNLPPVPLKKAGEVIRANASDYFPVDLKDYQLGYFVTAEPKKDDPNAKLKLMACVAPMAILDTYAETALAAGLKLASIDYAANAKFQSYKALNLEGATLYVDVDFNYTLLTFMRGDVLLLQRALPFGGGGVVSEYAAAAGLDEKGAVYALSDEARIEEIDAAIGAESVQDINERIYAGTARAHNVYEGQYADTPVERVVLAGVCAKMFGLREIFLRLNPVVHVIDELPRTAEVFPSVTPSEETRKFEYVYMPVASAAIAPVGLEPHNHERDERRRRRAERRAKADNSVAAGVALFVLFALIGGALSFAAWSDLQSAKKDRERVESEIKQLQYAQDIYDAFLQYRATAMNFARFANDVVISYNDNISAFFVELEEKMPSDILLLSAAFSEAGVTLNITVGTKEGAARVIETFRNLENLKEYDVLTSALTEADSAVGKRYSFGLTCSYRDYSDKTGEAPGDTIADDLEYLNNFHYKQRSYDFEQYIGGGN